jgi:hypothetical protein
LEKHAIPAQPEFSAVAAITTTLFISTCSHQ